MSHVLHLVRWDIRRFQLLLLFWILLVVASAVLEGAWPAIAVAMEARNTVGLAGNLLAVAEVLFSVALITLVVQEHSLVGTSAFWMTRPIPPRALLTAKLVLLSTAMVLVPVLAEVVLMVVYRVPAGTIAAVAAQSSIIWALWLAVVMIFAALTANMAKFALAVGAAIVTVIVSIVIMASILFDRLDDMPPIPTAGEMDDPTAGLVSTMLLIAAVVIALVAVYRTRARPRSIAIAVAGLAVSWAAGSYWSWPLLAPTVNTPAWALGPSGLQLSVRAGAVSLETSIVDFGVPPPPWRVARAPMRLSGLAPGWSAGVGLREGSLHIEGREALTSHVQAAPSSVAMDDAESVPNREIIRRLLNVERLVDWMGHTRPETAIVMVARANQVRRIPADRAEYNGTFSVSLTRHDIEAKLPLRGGAAVRDDAYRFAIDRIRPSQSRISVLARESNARSVFTRDPRSRIDYYLRNAQTSEAVQGSYRELRTDVTLSRYIPFIVGFGASENAGFRPVALEVNFSSGDGERREVVFDESWLAHSEFVIVRSIDSGAVERRLTIADFPIRTE